MTHGWGESSFLVDISYHGQELNNLRHEEDRMEEEITDIENELEVVKKQVPV